MTRARAATARSGYYPFDPLAACMSRPDRLFRLRGDRAVIVPVILPFQRQFEQIMASLLEYSPPYRIAFR